VAATGGGWVLPLLVLGLALAVMFGLLFREEAVAAIGVWESSTAYNHCWLVLPVALWLAWTRRDRLVGLRPAPLPAAALLGLPAAAAWFAAERLGIMEGRQLALIGMVWALFLAVLGWRVFRAMAAPLAYLIFLVPFGAFITPVLQDITARIIEIGLSFMDIPHFVDDLIIEIPAGTFFVAEACAGLRFLIAALAFGALYALMMFRSPGRRLIVMMLALVVPIIANGFRAFGIVLLGHYLGSAEAAAADHVIYGWIFFSVVILLLILAGLPFREDVEPRKAATGGVTAGERSPPVRAGPAGAVLAGAMAIAVCASGPAFAGGLEGRGLGTPSPGREVPLPITPPQGCEVEQAGLRCGSAGLFTVSSRLQVFTPRAGWGAVGAGRARAIGPIGEDDTTFTLTPAGGAIWQGRVLKDATPRRAIATAVWLDGQPAGGGLRSRLDQALNSLRGDRVAPALAVVTVTRPAGANPPAPASGLVAEELLLRALLSEPALAAASDAALRSVRPAR
jgi:exosortase A